MLRNCLKILNCSKITSKTKATKETFTKRICTLLFYAEDQLYIYISLRTVGKQKCKKYQTKPVGEKETKSLHLFF